MFSTLFNSRYCKEKFAEDAAENAGKSKSELRIKELESSLRKCERKSDYFEGLVQKSTKYIETMRDWEGQYQQQIENLIDENELVNKMLDDLKKDKFDTWMNDRLTKVEKQRDMFMCDSDILRQAFNQEEQKNKQLQKEVEELKKKLEEKNVKSEDDIMKLFTAQFEVALAEANRKTLEVKTAADADILKLRQMYEREEQTVRNLLVERQKATLAMLSSIHELEQTIRKLEAEAKQKNTELKECEQRVAMLENIAFPGAKVEVIKGDYHIVSGTPLEPKTKEEAELEKKAMEETVRSTKEVKDVEEEEEEDSWDEYEEFEEDEEVQKTSKVFPEMPMDDDYEEDEEEEEVKDTSQVYSEMPMNDEDEVEDEKETSYEYEDVSEDDDSCESCEVIDFSDEEEVEKTLEEKIVERRMERIEKIGQLVDKLYEEKKTWEVEKALMKESEEAEKFGYRKEDLKFMARTVEDIKKQGEYLAAAMKQLKP